MTRTQRERIRELEAELEDVRVSHGWHGYESVVKERDRLDKAFKALMVLNYENIARAERAEADFAQLKELPPETCPKCGDVQHSGPCREFNPDDPEDWDELPKAVRERYERAEAALKVAQSQYGVAYENLARAERAEALVQRARELIPDWPPEELRGEDRG